MPLYKIKGTNKVFKNILKCILKEQRKTRWIEMLRKGMTGVAPTLIGLRQNARRSVALYFVTERYAQKKLTYF